MTVYEKIAMVKTMIDIPEDDPTEDQIIGAYLKAAALEIINWRYSYAKQKPECVPDEYEMTQVFAVIAGYTQAGAEGETTHDEGSIRRIYKHESMIGYIRAHVIPIVRCI